MKEAKKEIWLEPGKICIAKGHSVAKNLMFKKKKDHRIFMRLWDRYLGKMTEVLNYHLSPDGWIIMFKAKTAEEIKLAYIDQRKRSRKAKKKHQKKEAKRMLSEHIRIFLSQYVRRINANHGRKGCLVMERFRKYVIQDPKTYNRIFNLLTDQERIRSQIQERYQADEGYYDQAGEMEKGSVWQVGRKYYEGVEGLERVLECMRLVSPKSSVLRKFFLNNIPPNYSP